MFLKDRSLQPMQKLSYHKSEQLLTCRRFTVGSHHGEAMTSGAVLLQENLRVQQLEREVESHRRALNLLIRLVDPEDVEAAIELQRITADSDKLRALVAKKPPPAEWFASDEELPC